MEEKTEALIKENEELKSKLVEANNSITFWSKKYNEMLKERDMIVFAVRKIVADGK